MLWLTSRRACNHINNGEGNAVGSVGCPSYGFSRCLVSAHWTTVLATSGASGQDFMKDAYLVFMNCQFMSLLVAPFAA